MWFSISLSATLRLIPNYCKSLKWQNCGCCCVRIYNVKLEETRSISHTHTLTHPLSGWNRQGFSAACVIIQPPTRAPAHFLAHLFLRLFQLCEEFASQMGQIPTATSKPASCLWSLNGVAHRLPSSSLSSSTRFSCSPVPFHFIYPRGFPSAT